MFLLLAAGCKEEYDDSALAGRVESLEQRMAAMEDLCERMNTNIGALQTVVSALQGHDYVTGVVPVKQGSETVGYTITFGQAAPITIYNGEDGEQGAPGEKGEDGYTPAIGVKQDTDGVYYWTVDGKWLTDEAGNKVKAVGSDGKEGEKGEQGEPGTAGRDGVTPQLKIENDYWYISYDNGASWTQLGKATGADGDAMFKEVTYDENFVYFTLAEGTTLTLPLTCKLDIVFAETEGIACLPGGSVKLAYTVTGGDEGTKVECVGDGGWLTKVSGGLEGTLMVTAPNPMTEGKVLVFATNGAGQVVMKALTFTEGVLSTVTDAYEVNAEGGTVEVEITTNMEYEVYIPEHAKEWVTLEPETRAEMRTDVLRFTIAKNQTFFWRTATIEVKDAIGKSIESFSIKQDYSPEFALIPFADEQVKQACVEHYDTNGDGELSMQEAANVTDLTGLFDNANTKSITSFNEFQYFTGVKEVPDSFFRGFTQMDSIRFPYGVERIGAMAFQECDNLEFAYLTLGIKTIGEFAFEYCNKLKYTNLPNSITSIGRYAYFECESLETIWLPDSITAINAGTFGYCTSLKDITFSQKITSIGESAFIACTSLESIYIPASITYIERWSFMNCTNLNSVYCEGETPPAIPYTVFTNISPEILYVPIGCTEKYKEGGWNIFQTIIEMDFSANN